MGTSIWQGKKVRLRAVETLDWHAFHENDDDSEIARLCYEIPFPRSKEASMKWAESVASASPADDAYRFAIENLEGNLVGTVNTFECNRRCGTYKYGIAILRKYWRMGYASDAISVLLNYYFRELRYQKVTVHIYAFNTASQALHEQLGFQQEGRLRRMIYTNGQFYDELIYGLTVDEFGARTSAV